MRILFIGILFFGLLSPSFAQHAVLRENTRNLFEKKSDFGPALKKFNHLFFGFGLMYDNPNLQNIRLTAWRSNSLSAGWRHKLSLLKFYAIGYDIYYQYNDFRIKQIPGKIFPDSALHTSEKLNFHQLGIELYQRFTFYQRGNLMGLFLDLGIYANYNYLIKYKEFDFFPNYVNNAQKRTIVYRYLNYVENYHYGIHARIGLNRVVLATEYRLSPLIKDSDVQLPPLWIEIQFGLHK